MGQWILVAMLMQPEAAAAATAATATSRATPPVSLVLLVPPTQRLQLHRVQIVKVLVLLP
jgi:hypothetical protein